MLYSTRTQNPSLWGFALGYTPTKDFCVADINMLVSKKRGGPNAKPGGPNTSPNVSQGNKVCVGYTRVVFALGI